MSEVVILTSAVGLGVYIPALLIRQQLRSFGVSVTVEVLEDFYTAKQQNSHLAHAQAHHANFALAQLAHRMARDVQDSLNDERIQVLLERWATQQCRHFIVWSGFWLPILERYRDLTGWALAIDHCRIDADISASFKIYPHLRQLGREIWLWHGESNSLVYEIGVGQQQALSFEQRQPRLMAHGGGWGIGTYQECAKELASVGFALDLVVHKIDEAPFLQQNDRAYQLQPNWQAWQRDGEGELQFPPMALLENGVSVTCKQQGDYHVLYDVIRNNQAIISKPGGCTLIDSLASATPVILLEPYGYAEARNGAVWQQLGFGIRYADWRASGYAPEILATLHNNLVNRTQRGLDYSRTYAELYCGMLPS
jgi:hypothetical protein